MAKRAKRTKRPKAERTVQDLLINARDSAHEVAIECLFPAIQGDPGARLLGALSAYSAGLCTVALNVGNAAHLRESIAVLARLKRRVDELLTALDCEAQRYMDDEGHKLVQE